MSTSRLDQIYTSLLKVRKQKRYCWRLQDRKELTYHIVRHTFATTVTLTNRVPIESVSQMLDIKTFELLSIM
jgi:hypothetical protein